MLQLESSRKKSLLTFAYGAHVLLPSLIWSVVFHGFFICIEPLFFVLLEGRLRTNIIRVMKTLWCGLFIIGLLATWNIPPHSYRFYLDVVLLSSPAVVLLGLASIVALLTVFVFGSGAGTSSRVSCRTQLIAGSVLLILKLMLAWGVVISNPLRQALVTPAQTADKVIIRSIISKPGSSGPISGPTFFNFVKSQTTTPPKIVLMVVESWGESANSLQQIANGLQDHGVKVVKFGFSAYQGATLQGEIRELCSQQIQLRNDFLLSDLRSECAPAYFARMGYRVLGMHGYKKEFYSRDLIWEKLGTAERYFDSDLKSLKRCAGPFSGVCDTNLIRYGTHLASGPEKTFLYLMTLSSHEPLPSPEVDADARYFADIETVTTTQVVARNAIASLVAELDSNSHGPCTLAYVVGDHQPPSAAAAGVLEADKVPFIAVSFNCGSAKPVPG
jgi:hypothetical protein